MVSKVLVGLHKLIYIEDEIHPTTGYRDGKRCINICSYCGSDVTHRAGVWMPESKKTVCNPIYVTNTSGSEMVVYPHLIESEDLLCKRDEKEFPIVCMNCGKVYSTALAIKTLDIVTILYF
jgi:hypothetical protein